jgi:hypothetical protein
MAIWNRNSHNFPSSKTASDEPKTLHEILRLERLRPKVFIGTLHSFAQGYECRQRN